MNINIFEQIKRINEYGNDLWSSRDLAKVLEYLNYQKFIKVIEKAKEACKNSGEFIHNHFAQAGEMVVIGAGAKSQ